MDVFMTLWHLQPYRCHECRKRFYLASAVHEQLREERAWRRAARKRRRQTDDHGAVNSAKIAS